MNKFVPNKPPGVADNDSPEWSEADFAWSVNNADFGGFAGAMAFLRHREEILRAAEAVGIAREAFLPFTPSKPGFEARVAEAYGPFAKAIGLAAE